MSDPTPAPSVDAVRSGRIVQSVGRVDSKVGWVVSTETSSGSPSLLVTVDGGVTWSEPRDIPPASQVQFVDANNGWAVGPGPWMGGAAEASASVSRTNDGGRTWLESQVPVGALPGNPAGTYGSSNVHFRDALTGELFVVFGPASALDKTADASPPPQAPAPICRHFSTTDGGATWAERTPAPCLDQVTFVNPALGYGSDARSPSVLSVTQDGGRTWITGHLSSPVIPASTTEGNGTAGSVNVRLLERRNDGSLRALVSWGKTGIVRTEDSRDGGRTWTISGKAGGFVPTGYQATTLGEGSWIATNEPGSSGAPTGLWTSHDAGLTWSEIATTGLEGSPTTITFVSATDGWLATSEVSCATGAAGELQPCEVTGSNVYATT